MTTPASNHANDLRIGPAGWIYADWSGVVYPKPRPFGFDPLAYLAQFVDLMEVNATFYASVSPKSADGWVARVAHVPRFRFVVKVWQALTHERALPSMASTAVWGQVLKPLTDAGVLSALLVQFPAAVRPGRWAEERVLAIRDRFPGIPLAVEQRHASAALEPWRTFLEKERFAFVNLDQPAIAEQLAPSSIVTADLAYVRLHGRNAAAWFDLAAGRNARYDYTYSGAQLSEWVARIGRLRAQAKHTLVVANNHFLGQAMAAALELSARIAGHSIPMPEPLLAHFSGLEQWARPEPGSLF